PGQRWSNLPPNFRSPLHEPRQFRTASQSHPLRSSMLDLRLQHRVPIPSPAVPQFTSPNAILSSNCNRHGDSTNCRGRTCEISGGAKPASSAIENRLSQEKLNSPFVQNGK